MTNSEATIIDLTNSFSVTDIIEITDSPIQNRPIIRARSRKSQQTKDRILLLPPAEENVERFKKKRYIGFGDCPICWDELGANPLASTKCGHVYCLKCIEQYIKYSKTCPTCRRDLRGASSYHPIYLSKNM